MALEREDRDAIVEAIQAGFDSRRSSGGSGGGSSGGDGGSSRVFEQFRDGVGNTTTDLLKFGGTLFSSGARVSDAAGVVTGAFSNFAPILGSTVSNITDTLGDGATAIIKAAEDGVDTYRTLASSGAAFNNNILLMKNSAAQSRLTLDEFASIVSANSQDFAAFGGTVTKGARLFADASRQMFDEGVATPLLNMGMTFEEVNEDLAEFIIRNRRRFTQEEIRAGKAAEAAVAMATEMDKIAKLTGQERKEMEKEVQSRLRKGQVEAKIRQLEMSGNTEAAEKMRLALAEASKAGPGALAAVEDLFTKGAVVSEEGRAAAVALGPAFSNLQGMVAAASGPGGIETMNASIDSFNTAIAARINDPNFLNMATLGGMNNQFADAAAGLVATAGTYADNVQALMDEEGISRSEAIRRLDEIAGEEQGARDGVTSTVINGERALRDLGAVINDSLLGENGAITALSNSIKPLARELEALNLGSNNSDEGIRDEARAITDGVINAANAASEIITGRTNIEPPDPNNQPSDIVASRATKEDMIALLRQMQNMEGLQESDAYALAAALGSTVGPEVAEALRRSADENFNGDLRAQMEELLLRGPSNEIAQVAEELYKHKYPDSTETQQDMFRNSLINGQGVISIDELLDRALGVVDQMTVGSISAASIDLPGREFGGPVEKDQAYVVGERRAELFVPQQSGFIVPSISNLETSISGAMNQVRPQMQQAITQIDTSQLETIMSNFAQQAQTIMNNPSTQDSFREVAEMLNTNLQEQTGLLANQARTARKQLKSMGGLSGNLFRGIG